MVVRDMVLATALFSLYKCLMWKAVGEVGVAGSLNCAQREWRPRNATIRNMLGGITHVSGPLPISDSGLRHF